MCQTCRIDVFINTNKDGQVFYRLRGASVPPTVWELGGAGLVGADVTEEQDVLGLRGEGVATIEGLRFVLAGRPSTEQRFWDKYKQLAQPLVGTSYPGITRQLLGRLVDIKFIEGAAETLPYLFPEVDAICELVRTGDTLRQNKQKIFKELAPVRLMLVRQAESGTI